LRLPVLLPAEEAPAIFDSYADAAAKSNTCAGAQFSFMSVAGCLTL
jgi:hypothetical protein